MTRCSTVDGRLESNPENRCAMRQWPASASASHSLWHMGDDDLRAGRLQVVLPDYYIADTGIYAVMPQRRLVPPRVRAFVEFLAEHFRTDSRWNPVPSL